MSMNVIPRVSVIVPNYNHARFLKQRLDSVLGQTYQDFELIILDDASLDNSREIIESYANHPKLRCLFNTKNSGSTFVQWNRGLREARGEYVWIAESDDYADRRLLEVLVQKLDLNPRAGLAYCQSWQVADDGQISLVEYYYGEHAGRWRSDFMADGKQEVRQYLVFKNTIPNASAVLFRRDLALQVGLADEDFKLVGDLMFWVKLLAVSDVAFVGEPLNYWRHHRHAVRYSTATSVALEEVHRVLRFVQDEIGIRNKALRKARFDWHLAGAQSFTGQVAYGLARHHLLLALANAPVAFAQSVEVRKLMREQLQFYIVAKGFEPLQRKYYRTRIWAGAQRRNVWNALKAFMWR
jgi:glycosyltransferase involved in cell wall biosynthesis